MAFNRSDGSLAWTFDRRGGGPEEFGMMFGLALAPGGGFLILDRGNLRIVRLSEEGRLESSLPLRGVLAPMHLCTIDDSILITSGVDRPAPLVLLGADGAPRRELEFPWPALRDHAPIVRQVRLAQLPEGEGCVVALSAGVGLAVLRADSDPTHLTYRDARDLPQVEVAGPRQMLPAGAVTLNTLSVDRQSIVLQDGRRGPWLDRYDLSPPRYSHSMRVPGRVSQLAHDGDFFVLLTEGEEFSGLVALRLRTGGR